MRPAPRIRWQRPALYPLQEACVFGPERFAAVEGSPKSTKTTAAMVWALEQAMFRKRSRGVWAAPTIGQAKIAWDRIQLGFPSRFISRVRASPYPEIVLANASRMTFVSGEIPKNLFGAGNHWVVLDEAGRCREATWDALRTTLDASLGPARLLANRDGRNWFWHLCRAIEAGRKPGWKYYRLTWRDAVEAGVVSLQAVEDARRDLPEHRFRELYELVDPDHGDNPFGKEHLDRAVTDADCGHGVQGMVDWRSEADPVCWGWDLAKSVDWTVGVGLDADRNVCRIVRFQNIPWPAVSKRMEREVGELPAKVDATGVGRPIVDGLQERGLYNFEPFLYTAASRQQILEALALSIQQGVTRFPRGVLEEELRAFEFVEKAGRVAYAVPDGLHDDCVFAYAQANLQFTTGRNPVPRLAAFERH